MIKLNPPFIDVVQTLQLMEKVLTSGTLTQGEMVLEFEDLCAEMANADFAVAVSNATVGLELVLGALRYKPGDEVITTPFTFKATINAILRAGAVPRFADILDDYTIDPESVKNLINEKTRAIVAVHMYGYPADLKALYSVIGDRNILVIEDAAQAHGSRYCGKPVGAQSLAGVFSFYATKNVGAGEGGCITTNSHELADHLVNVRNHQRSRSIKYNSLPTNARMSELNAAVAIPQLKNLRVINDVRRANAAKLINYTGFDSQYDPNRWGNYHLYTIEVNDPCKFINYMRDRGIECASYYRYIYDSYMLQYANGTDKFPKAYEKAKRVVSLPVHPGLTEEEVEYIGESYLEYRA